MRDNNDSLVIPKVVSEVADMVGTEKTVELSGLSLENVNKKTDSIALNPCILGKIRLKGISLLF